MRRAIFECGACGLRSRPWELTVSPPLRGLIPAVVALAISPALLVFLGAALVSTSRFRSAGQALIAAVLIGGPLLLYALSAWLLARAHEPLWGVSALGVALALGIANVIAIVLGLELATSFGF